MNPVPRYPLNTTVTFYASIVDQNGNPVDPTQVLFMCAGSDGVTYTFNPTYVSVGNYAFNFVTSTPTGVWHARYQGIGALNVQSPDIKFIVDNTYF